MEESFSILSCPITSFVDQGEIANFDCGIKLMNDFLVNDAIKKHNSNLAKTTIFYDKANKKIIGFYTINTATLTINDKDNPTGFEFPTIHLSYLARDNFYKRKGFGTFMIRELYFSLVVMGRNLGFSLLTTSALNNATEFYKDIGFRPVTIDPDIVDYWVEEFQMYINYDDMLILAEYRRDLVNDGYNPSYLAL